MPITRESLAHLAPNGVPDLQAIYNHVRDHLLRQNAKSLQEDGHACLYRGAAGRACAAGACMTDEAYEAAAPEGQNMSDPRPIEAVTASLGVSVEHFAPSATLRLLLQRLQNVHDNWQPPKWAQELADAAEHFGLTYKPCPNCANRFPERATKKAKPGDAE